MAADTGADRPVHGERGGEQGAEAEQAEHLAEQAVAALGLRACLLPVRDVGDRSGAEQGDGALDGVVRVVGVGQPQAGHLAAAPSVCRTAEGSAHTRPGRSPGR